MRIDYIFTLVHRGAPLPFKGISPTRLSRTPVVNFFTNGIVVELYLSVLDADCPLLKCLGFNHALSIQFFLLLQHSHLYHLRYYVVVQKSLRSYSLKEYYSSNSMDYFSCKLLYTQTSPVL